MYDEVTATEVEQTEEVEDSLGVGVGSTWSPAWTGKALNPKLWRCPRWEKLLDAALIVFFVGEALFLGCTEYSEALINFSALQGGMG